MALRHCVECGHAVSDSAGSCPACSTKTPFGVFCELCRDLMRPFEGLDTMRTYYAGDVQSEKVYAHRECIRRWFTVPAAWACPDCKLRISDIDDDTTPATLWVNSVQVRCPHCGAMDLLGTGTREWRDHYLYRCHAPVYSFQVPPQGQGHGHPPSASLVYNKTGCAGLLAAVTLVLLALRLVNL
jgi:hypothetical protein